jgi:hypothetical protein
MRSASRGQMRVNVKVSGNNVRGEFCYHGDTLDMEAFRQRAAFVEQAAHELAAKEDTIHREVGQLWTALAELQRERIARVLAPQEETSLMTAEEQTAAMDLLRDPRLLGIFALRPLDLAHIGSGWPIVPPEPESPY